MKFNRFTFAVFFAAGLVTAGCETTKAGRRYARDDASAMLKRLEVVSLELGEFPIEGGSSVIDGDTIRVKGLNSSLRLLALDTEETFKHEDERRAYAAGWEQYKKAMRGNSKRPVKMASPNGDEAKKFAQGFFEGATKVRLERDHPGEIRDFYGRYLAYVFVEKNGKWVNYATECIRAGYSPYFVKYGRSRRFHKEFMEAERAAREQRLGIWSPGGEHYDDYEERLKWWWEREGQIARFEKQMAENPKDHIALTRFDAMLRLEQMVGQTVTVLGAVSEVRFGEKGPSVIKLSRSRGNDLDIVFFDKDVLVATGAQFKRGEYIQVRGVVNKYRDSYRNVDKVQLLVALPGQVLAPSAQLDALLSEDAPTADKKSDEGD